MKLATPTALRTITGCKTPVEQHEYLCRELGLRALLRDGHVIITEEAIHRAFGGGGAKVARKLNQDAFK